MKIGVIPENSNEQAALEAGVIPTPVVETIGLIKIRILMAAVKLGLFEAIGSGSFAVQEISARLGTHPFSTGKLLDALTGAGYLSKVGERFSLAAVTSQWLLRDSPNSLHDYILMQYLVWGWLAHCEDYISTGQAFIIHPQMTEEEWGIYQRSMRALAGFRAEDVARLTPVPEGARTMLDLGGSHGYNSVALCRRYPDLKAVVMDLPQAVKHAGPILEKEGMGDRVRLRAGNALTTDLGVGQWDLILMANLIQNFDQAGNRELVQRAARALRPGGVLVIQESFQPSRPESAGQDEVLLDFMFAMTSPSQTWSEEQIAAWQREAGLAPLETIYFPGSRGYGQQAAVKPD
jgi:SAM-dependent methyltransferase